MHISSHFSTLCWYRFTLLAFIHLVLSLSLYLRAQPAPHSSLLLVILPNLSHLDCYQQPSCFWNIYGILYNSIPYEDNSMLLTHSLILLSPAPLPIYISRASSCKTSFFLSIQVSHPSRATLQIKDFSKGYN